MPLPIRVLIAKIGLDGHDRGAKLIVRNLRDAGMDVIYTGLWQTPAATVQAAIQEDVDVLGVSLLSAAHMTIMPEVRRLCREAGAPELPVVVGGIIPESDGHALRQQAIDGVFNPGTPMRTIVDAVRTLATAYRSARASSSGSGGTLALAREITRALENGESPPAPAPGEKAPCVCIGVTGAPGVGKSTFIGRLARVLRARGRRVGVVAVDPSSPVTGGALLGDRLRMMSPEPDAGLFVRSLSSRGQAGGLAPHCADVVRLLQAGGYPIVLLETVGAGQNDTQIRQLVDEVVLVLMPGAGDSIQFAKAGVVEIATAFVVTKSDIPGADTTVRQLRESFDDDRPIWTVAALRGEGFEPVAEWIEQRLG